MRSYVLAVLAVAIVVCLVQYASAGGYGGQRQVYSTYQAQPRRISRYYQQDFMVRPGGQIGGAGGYYGGAMNAGYGGYGGIGRRGGLFGLSWMWILLILFLLFFLLNDK